MENLNNNEVYIVTEDWVVDEECGTKAHVFSNYNNARTFFDNCVNEDTDSGFSSPSFKNDMVEICGEVFHDEQYPHKPYVLETADDYDDDLGEYLHYWCWFKKGFYNDCHSAYKLFKQTIDSSVKGLKMVTNSVYGEFVKDTKILSVFPACGKTWMFDHQDELGVSILDSDSSDFSWSKRKLTKDEIEYRMSNPHIHSGVSIHDFGSIDEYRNYLNSVEIKERNPEFPNNYIKYIKSQMGKYDYIFISSHETVRKVLNDEGVDFIIVFPIRQCLNEWIGRCHIRETQGKQGFPINILMDNWDKWIDQCFAETKNHQFIILNHGEYLGDYFNSSMNNFKSIVANRLSTKFTISRNGKLLEDFKYD